MPSSLTFVRDQVPNFKAEYKNELYLKRHRLIDAIKLAVGCQDCKITGPAIILTFDHVRGVKKFGVSQKWQVSLAKFYEEVAKCEVVCFNCHMIREHNRRNHGD